MDKVTENHLSMFKDVKLVYDSNTAVISVNVGLNDTYVHFNSMVNDMDAIAVNQSTKKTGVTEDKQFARDNLNLSIDEATGIIMEHFDGINFEVYGEVNIYTSVVEKMADQRVITFGTRVYELLTEHQPALSVYGVDATYIDAFKAVLDIYSMVVAKPTLARNIKSAYTQLLKLKSQEIRKFLKRKLDKGMRVYRKTNPTLYLTYINARRIVNNGLRHKNFGIISGVVKDSESHLVLDDALVEVVGTTTKIVTNESGLFTIFDVPPGTYTLQVSIGGYAIKTIENVVVVKKETVELEVLMVAV